MPTLKLQWGLWNQMFQYALMYRLSRQYDEPILYDGCSVLENRYLFANWTFRHYELDVFGIKKQYDFPSFLEWRLVHPKFYEYFYRFKYWDRYIYESAWEYIIDFPRNAYLDWWFQSYKYFEWYEQELQDIFTVRTAITEQNKKYLDKIQKCLWCAVSLHIRRGDYVTLDGASKWHGTCSIGYYEIAISHMVDFLKNPVFFVFSDDISWCRENLQFSSWTELYYIENNESQWHEDLRLMYSCHHHIIANSSFSWWWAYLGRNNEKIVIAPKKWLQTDSFNTVDLIPKSWIRL